MFKAVISGQVPSKKNNKRILINRRTGRSFIASSKRFEEWEELASTELSLSPCRPRRPLDGAVSVRLRFFNKDNRRHDLDNMTSSILDLLTDGCIIEDDDCTIVSRLDVEFGGVDRSNPRCEIEVKCA